MKKKVESDFKKQMNKRLNGRTQPPSSVPKKKNHKKTLFQNKQFKFQQQISKNFFKTRNDNIVQVQGGVGSRHKPTNFDIEQ